MPAAISCFAARVKARQRLKIVSVVQARLIVETISYSCQLCMARAGHINAKVHVPLFLKFWRRACATETNKARKNQHSAFHFFQKKPLNQDSGGILQVKMMPA